MPDLKGRHLHGEKLSTSPSMDSSRRARLPGAVGAQDHRAGRANRRRRDVSPWTVTPVIRCCSGSGWSRSWRAVPACLRTATYKLAILMALIGRLWCGARLLATMSPVTTLSP